MKKIIPLFSLVMLLTSFFNIANAETNVLSAQKSNVTTLYKQLDTYLKTTADQKAKTIPILEAYDKSVDEVKVRNAGNNPKIQQEVNVLNTKTIESLKKVLNNEQVLKLIVAITTNDNITSGKNLDANQKAFITKMRNQYALNDAQLTAVTLVMVQGKLRGDAIGLLTKTNQQQAGQEYIKLLQDLDGQLKSALSPEQYAKVKTDIEKLIKGQKL